MIELVELRLENVILFSIVLNVQTGLNAKFELVNELDIVAQDGFVVMKVVDVGNIIFMRPDEEIGSRVVRLNV